MLHIHYVCMHACMQPCMFVCKMHACMYEFMHACIFACTPVFEYLLVQSITGVCMCLFAQLSSSLALVSQVNC